MGGNLVRKESEPGVDPRCKRRQGSTFVPCASNLLDVKLSGLCWGRILHACSVEQDRRRMPVPGTDREGAARAAGLSQRAERSYRVFSSGERGYTRMRRLPAAVTQ